MRVLVTGATGFIGLAIVRQLRDAGHQVVGLARSDEAAATLPKWGGEAYRGELADTDSLVAGARASDGVIHTAFGHDFSKYEEASETDRRAVEAMADALAGSAKPPVVSAEAEWIRPPAVPGTFVVNTGAMLARYSNDRFRATPHRVINRNDASRYAIPFFLGPNHDSIVDCVPTCVGPDTPPRYEPTTYGAFSQRLLALYFAHRRADGDRKSTRLNSSH